MGENLVAGILKNIETLANVNYQQNISILTSIKKTNTILSKEIGKELQKQTKLLQSITEALTKSNGGNSFSIFGSSGTKDFSKLFSKKGDKTLTKMALGMDKFAIATKKFVEAINELDTEKFTLFTSIFDMGKKILKFALIIALSGPLLAIGLLTTLPLLVAWVMFFNWVGSSSKRIKKGAKMLMYMAISTGVIALTVIMTAYALGDPIKTLMAFTLVAGSLLILSAAFLLISLASKPLKTGAKIMLFMAISTAILVAIVVVASMMIGSPKDTLIAFGLMAGSILILALSFVLIGMFKSNILSGSIAMIIASVALGIIIFSMIQFTKAKISWEDIGKIGAIVAGLGGAMALAGVASVFIGLGAGVMLLAGSALYIITESLINFKKAEWTKQNSENLESAMSSIVNSFVNVFENISYSDMMQMMAGSVLLGSIGNSLSALAEGLLAFANGEQPHWEEQSDGTMKVVGTKPLGKDLGKRVGITLESMLEPLVGKPGSDGSDSILGRLGAGSGLIFDGPIGNGIDLLGRLGNSLGNFALGVQGWADLKIPVYEMKDGKLQVVKYNEISKTFAQDVGNNIKAMVKSLTEPLEFLGSKSGGWFSSSDYENGIEKLGELGEPLANLAKGVEIFAGMDIDTNKVKSVISATIDSFVMALSKDSLKGLDEKKGKKVLDGFNYFANAVEKMKGGETEKVGSMFVSIKDSINDMDLKKLNKLTTLAQHLSKFAENMKGSFGDLEDVLDKLVDVIAEMNGVEIKSTPQSNNNTNAPGEVKIELQPLVLQLEEIHNTLLSGIEVDVKESLLNR